MPLTYPWNISEQCAAHILQGDDKGGGGHSPRTPRPNKSIFPLDWSDQLILDVISDVATDPTIIARSLLGGRAIREAKRTGIVVRVVSDAAGHVITGYPILNKADRSS